MKIKLPEQFLKKYFWLTCGAVFLAPLIILSLILVRPFYSRDRQAQGDLETAKNLLTKKQDEAALFAKSWEKISSLSLADQKKLTEILPTNKDIEGLLQILEDKAAAQGFILKNLEINEAGAQEKTPVSGVKQLKIAANFAGGDYAAFKKLLQSLEKTARLLDVASINFASQAANYALNISAYWLPETAQLVSGQLNEQIFSDPAFQNLEPSRADLKAEPIGKDNPFK